MKVRALQTEIFLSAVLFLFVKFCKVKKVDMLIV